jgi:lipoprotein-anchoring transpeptidase ErfK/SrfK
MTRILLTIVIVLGLVLGASVGGLALADHHGAQHLAAGTRVAGVEVGGLTRETALARLEQRIGSQVDRPVRVRVGSHRYTLSATRAGVGTNLQDAVQRAYQAGRGGNLLHRGWRQLTDTRLDRDVPIAVTVDRSKVRAFVKRIGRDRARPATDASMDLQVDRVSVVRGRSGRRLAGGDALVNRVADALTARTGTRTLRARTVAVPPKVTTEDLWAANPVAVTVSRDDKRVRVFRRGELVRTYNVAVGEPKYPTPVGSFVVQSMQKNPTWTVPNSAWAGDLAGKVIKGGDPQNPLVARWIGFNGSVGFHGTKSADSLGRAASHGCVRMAPGDVTDLYERLQVGSPVLVA